MPRPTSQQEIISLAENTFEKMWEEIYSMTEVEQNAIFNFDDRDRNVRDVLVHLYEWHQLILNWVKANIGGIKQPFLPLPYNWKTYGQMNIEVIWRKHQKTSYQQAQDWLYDSHHDVIKLLKSFSDEELFTKAHFSWVGTSHLGSYFVSTTSAHYEWARQKLKKHLKTCRYKE